MSRSSKRLSGSSSGRRFPAWLGDCGRNRECERALEERSRAASNRSLPRRAGDDARAEEQPSKKSFSALLARFCAPDFAAYIISFSPFLLSLVLLGLFPAVSLRVRLVDGVRSTRGGLWLPLCLLAWCRAVARCGSFCSGCTIWRRCFGKKARDNCAVPFAARCNCSSVVRPPRLHIHLSGGRLSRDVPLSICMTENAEDIAGLRRSLFMSLLFVIVRPRRGGIQLCVRLYLPALRLRGAAEPAAAVALMTLKFVPL